MRSPNCRGDPSIVDVVDVRRDVGERHGEVGRLHEPLQDLLHGAAGGVGAVERERVARVVDRREKGKPLDVVEVVVREDHLEAHRPARPPGGQRLAEEPDPGAAVEDQVLVVPEIEGQAGGVSAVPQVLHGSAWRSIRGLPRTSTGFAARSSSFLSGPRRVDRVADSIPGVNNRRRKLAIPARRGVCFSLQGLGIRRIEDLLGSGHISARATGARSANTRGGKHGGTLDGSHSRGGGKPRGDRRGVRSARGGRRQEHQPRPAERERGGEPSVRDRGDHEPRQDQGQGDQQGGGAVVPVLLAGSRAGRVLEPGGRGDLDGSRRHLDLGDSPAGLRDHGEHQLHPDRPARRPARSRRCRAGRSPRPASRPRTPP